MGRGDYLAGGHSPPTPNLDLRLREGGLYDDPNVHVPGEPPDKDLDYDDLVELYGYDEDRGLTTLVL